MSNAGENVIPGFEGVEKVLEIDFTPGLGPARGLRDIPRASWDLICEDARCTILDTLSNERLDSYVLSESSLFVYPLKIIIKTCGTTTLLMCIPRLMELTKAMGMKVEWVAYTRKDFLFPHVQKFPHRDPQEEMTYLKTHFPEGSAFIMGPLTSDHWFVFVADYVDRPTEQCVDRTLDIMMFGLDEEVAKLFVKDEARFPKHSDVTKASGIDTLLPGSQIQEFCFDPCGYSMNGLLYDSYWTIHITPESHCSYASFETNIRMANYSSLIKAVLAIFRPKKFTMTLFADEHGLKQMKEMPFSKLLNVPVVEAATGAIMGPCVLLADGNVSAGLAPSLAEEAAAAAAGGTPKAAAAAAAAASAAAGSASAAGEASSATASGSDAPASPSRAPSGSGGKEVVAAAGGGPATSSTTSGMVARKGTASYVLSHKSASEFMGYSCFLSNYAHIPGTLPSNPGPAGGRKLEEHAPESATAALAMPRAKYVVSKEITALKQRIRTESI